VRKLIKLGHAIGMMTGSKGQGTIPLKRRQTLRGALVVESCKKLSFRARELGPGDHGARRQGLADLRSGRHSRGSCYRYRGK
jgi:hypothetical protein